ncbi:MAG: GAF domain-containing protein [Proteobacteria bacterium]|nr:GAF domain-containing protein [Pseudomonadota bacterium]
MSDETKSNSGEAVLAIFKRGADFTRKLLSENERLRHRVNELETRTHMAAQNPHDWEQLRLELVDRISQLEHENKSIIERLKSVEQENQQFAERYLEIEEENNNLANLYVASYQLHSTLDPSEVLKVIVEIVINLIGAEVFCVYVHDDKTDVLEPVAAEGERPSAFPRVGLGQGVVGKSVQTGETACAEGGSPAKPFVDGGDPVVCIPLRVQDRPMGAIVIQSLLQQKDGFSPLDHELFTLLAGHAATAIFASRLYSQSERKLNTIQGFIDLLTK